MGFLSGVLGAVKNTRTYNVGKTTYLQNILNLLKPKLCSGHTGFKSVITDVVKGVSRYNASLQSSNHKIKSPIDELLNAVKEESKWRNDINKINVENADDTAVKKAEVAVKNSLEECKRFADKFNAKFNFSANKNNIKEAIENLNCDLSTKTKNCLCIVKHESERLEKLAEKEKEDLEATKKCITDTLKELENQVKIDINREVKNLVAHLKGLVLRISVHLKSIKRELTKYVEALAAWIKNADKMVNGVITEVAKIEQKEPGMYNKKTVEGIAAAIEQWGKDLNTYVEDMKSTIKKHTVAASENLTKLDKVYKDKLLEIAEAVNEIKPAIEALGKQFPRNDHGSGGTLSQPSSTKGVVEDMLDNIRGNIVDIKGNDGRNSRGLQGVNGRMEKYARAFKDSMAKEPSNDGTVGKWIDEILKDEGVVWNRIKRYVELYEKNLKVKELAAVMRIVKTQIKSRLSEVVTDTYRNFQNEVTAAEADGCIKKNVLYVQKVCHALSTALSKKIKIEQDTRYLTTSFVSEIVGLIGGDVVNDGESTDKSYFYEAVTGTLAALASAAERYADEAANLALKDENGTDTNSRNIAAMLQVSFDKAKKLQEEVYNALGKTLPGSPHTLAKPNFAHKVDKAILDAETQVEHITGRSGGEVSLEGNPVKALRDEAYNPLNKAIEDIESQASILNVEPTKTQLGNWSIDIKKELVNMFDAFAFSGKIIKDVLIKLQKAIGHTASGKQDDDMLQNIHEQLNVLLTKDLTDAIELTENFPGEAAEFQKKCVDELHKHVGQKTKESIDKLTTHAQKQYVSSIKLLLQAFGNKACEELEELPKEIDDDLTVGFKGFMLRMAGKEDHSSGQDTKLGAIKTVVEDASDKPMKERFAELAKAFHAYFTPIHDYTKKHITPNPAPHTPDANLTDLGTVNNNLADLLNHLTTTTRTYIFDHNYSTKLDTLKSSLDHLRPSNFANIQNPALVDALKSGINALAKELSKTYLNAYDGASDGMILVDARNDKVTDDGKRCAKVCLNVLSILYAELNTLVKHCQSSSRSEQINKLTNVGKFFLDQGYDVSDSGKQNGELQDDKRMTVFFICKRLFGNDEKHIYRTNQFNQEIGPLKKLHDHLQTYYQVGHVATSSSKKTPCSIFEMLCWLSGLPCNTVYEELWRDAVSDLFVDPKKQTTEDDISMSFVGDEPVSAYPTSIECDAAQRAVKRLCSRSYDVLIEIVGYGNEHTQYAVDYCDNSLRLAYPSDPSQCLELLLDILRRLLPVCRFLHSQCQLETHHLGWSNCLYGKDILTGKSHCNKHTDDKQTDCLPRSPLQSYLSDTLPGHLPHNVTAMGCKSVCSNCPKGLPGQPCLTPLGFRGFSGSTKPGKELCKVLTKFFDNSNINTLFGLMPKPPSTLPEHFQFALSLANMLKNEDSSKAAVSTAFNKSINAVSIELYKDSSKLTNALTAAYGSSQNSHDINHHKSKSPDMSSLSMDQSCMLAIEDNVHCGPYMQSLFCDSYNYITAKHASVYLSWAVYLPWSLYSYLKSLFDSYNSISCQDWGCSRCVDGSSCRPGKHGDGYSCKCRSLVGCRGVLSTLYSYGFTFGDAKKLLSDTERRYCRNFYAQFQNVLKSQHFTKLFDECDNFIWTIREPFTYLVLALWSLSLFYLICVMVGRLDVLHIRSHLRIPSSHKITAQSLLAAAQVGRLAKISYLQP